MSSLSLTNARVVAGGTTILNDVSLHVGSGQIVGLLGPNGAGKTTAMRALLGLQKLTDGNATIMGRDTFAMTPNQRAQCVSYLPQTRGMIWPISVRETIALGLFAHGRNDKAINEIMAQCDLAHLAQRTLSSLSGGEIARVHLARALVSHTPALVVDEPTNALDPRHQFACLDLLAQRARDGAAVLVILHDVTAAARYCDEIILLDNASLVTQGRPRDVLSAHHLAQVYGVTGAWHGDQLTVSPPVRP
jgi:iron complex transport system ATP-binding protein